MKLNHGLHLAYCTNIHRGETWAEMFEALHTHTLAVRERVAAGRPFAIGLRLSHRAAVELSDPPTLTTFRRWLDAHDCYVFTINGFPYGQFHGTRVKEQVYAPDWTTPERFAYTNRLFDLLAKLLPPDVEGSVSTVPGSFKEFIRTPEQEKRIRQQLWACVHHVELLCRRTGQHLHLGLEPEPLGYLETSEETVRFFEQMHQDYPNDPRITEHLGVNYDACHFAVEFEEPRAALARLRQHEIKLSKIHLSSALKLRPTSEARAALATFAEDTYLHQVVARGADGQLRRCRDLPDALGPHFPPGDARSEEWRVHFHIPLHSPPGLWFEPTTDHVLGVLDVLREDPGVCTHLEMETYTWEVLPPEMKQRTAADQLVGEYDWTLEHLRERGLGLPDVAHRGPARAAVPAKPPPSLPIQPPVSGRTGPPPGSASAPGSRSTGRSDSPT